MSLLLGLLVGMFLMEQMLRSKMEERLERKEAGHKAYVDSLLQTILDMKKLGYEVASPNDPDPVYVMDNEYELEVEAARRNAKGEPPPLMVEDPYGIHLPMKLSDG